MIIRTLDDGLEVHRVDCPEEIAACRDSFASAYVRVFSEPPYQERFTEAEAGRIWDRLVADEDAVVLVVLEEQAVVGFAIATPLLEVPDVARELAGLVPPRHTMYLAELGVLPSPSEERLRRLLAHQRLKLIDEDTYSHVVLRAPSDARDVVEMYRELGFTDMGVSMQVTQMRTDGQVRSDERSFMGRVRSQVHVDEGDV